MLTTTEKSAPATALDGYRPIPFVALRLLGTAGISVYCLREQDPKPELLCNLRQPLDEKQIAEIKSHDYVSLLVLKQDFPTVSQKLHAIVDSTLADTSISIEVRFALLQIAYAEELDRHFCKARLEQYVVLAQKVGKKISALLQQGEVSILELHFHAHHNSANYTHVTNVAAYAVILAQALNPSTPEELDRIAVGCLLHEVGKLYLPQSVLTKKGRLSARDHQELESIPQLAYEALLEFEEIDFGQLMMAYQQHERVDGTGYPVRYLAEDIHPWAKLLAVVDVFDAMTNDRDYRSAMNMRDVLVHLADRSKTHFAPEVVLCMITNFQSP
ncbi:MAG: HD domain-containing protein [Planctomycetes bacterium]|nr:HD domain-containing protein [Planctomycetota bacterium]